LVSFFVVIASLLLAACSDPETTGGTGGSGGSGGSAGPGGGGGGEGGSGSSICPSAVLGPSLPITHDGTTVGRPNIVESPRLEWTDAGDDALLFVATEAATYKVSVPLAEPGCGASLREYGPLMDGFGTIYDTTFCPEKGQIVIDGVFVEPTGTEVPLPVGQEMLIWVSCSTSAPAEEAKYQIMIEKL
jgi:hypothetical protein